jgi:hypothetical protein
MEMKSKSVIAGKDDAKEFTTILLEPFQAKWTISAKDKYAFAVQQ